ncbi:MAG TPA: MFS transporter, partial [Acetobacteraceae bacterium]|nr:MFS transporter [Acetobacteraceae bacterium]
MLTQAERRRSLVAAIACVAVFGLSIGEGGPLLSLLLEARGTNAAITGLNAGAAFIGVLVGPMLTPRWLLRFGIRSLLVTCFALDIVTFLMLKVFDGLEAWFVLRVLLGLIGSTLFTTSEAWISLLAGDTARGRIIGIYAAALSVGFGLGPLLLSITGIEGWPPFVLNGVIVASSAIPVLLVGDLARGLGQERAGNPLAFFARAPLIVFAVAVFGVYETALLTLLPIWGVRVGLGTSVAAGTLSAVYFGAIVLQVPIGWLSDHMDRLAALRLCGVVGVVGAVLLIAGGTWLPVLFGL